MGVVAPATVICPFIPQTSLAQGELSRVGPHSEGSQVTETWLLRGTQEIQSGWTVELRQGMVGQELQPDVWPLEGDWTCPLSTREPWKVFELGKAMVSWVFEKLSLASILEGIVLGGVSPGKQLGWERSVCTRVGLWEGEEVQVGEEPRRLCELTMGLAGCGGE